MVKIYHVRVVQGLPCNMVSSIQNFWLELSQPYSSCNNHTLWLSQRQPYSCLSAVGFIHLYFSPAPARRATPRQAPPRVVWKCAIAFYGTYFLSGGSILPGAVHQMTKRVYSERPYWHMVSITHGKLCALRKVFYASYTRSVFERIVMRSTATRVTR